MPAIDLPIRNAVFTFEHASPGTLVNGVIGGVMATEDVVAAARPFMRHTSCTGDLSIIEQSIREASDMRADGTNPPGVPCDAISIGIGFEAVEVASVTSVGADPTVDAGACPSDAGAD